MVIWAVSSPKKDWETRRVVEQKSDVFFFFSLGPGNLAVRKYLNDLHIPQVFVLAPTERYNDPQHFPWTIGLQPTYYLDGQIHARYILAHKPDAKIAVLHENEDIAKEAVKGFKDGLGNKGAQLIVKEQSYEISDPTIDTQMLTL